MIEHWVLRVYPTRACRPTLDAAPACYPDRETAVRAAQDRAGAHMIAALHPRLATPKYVQTDSGRWVVMHGRIGGEDELLVSRIAAARCPIHRTTEGGP